VVRLAALVLLAGCPDEADPCAGGAAAGELDAGVELEIVVQRDCVADPVSEGATIPVIEPPQGGKVVIAGARVRNIVNKGVKLSGWLRDPASERVYGLVIQPVRLDLGSDGWLSPRDPASIDNYANISACPMANLPRDVHGEPWVLGIRVEDCAGRSAERQITVTPTCAPPDPLRCIPEVSTSCECECDMNYYDTGFTCP
jgi:hypothetical protein